MDKSIKEYRGGEVLESKAYKEYRKRHPLPEEKARENLGVKEIFQKPIKKHWNRKVDEGMDWDEMNDNRLQDAPEGFNTPE